MGAKSFGSVLIGLSGKRGSPVPVNEPDTGHIVIRTDSQQLTARSEVEIRQTAAPLLEQLMTKSEIQCQSVSYFPIILNEPLILRADGVLRDAAEIP